MWITSFSGAYSFLSNFYITAVTYKGITYTNAEAAFQAQKTLNPTHQEQFHNADPRTAKRLGKKVELRADWEDIKDDIMYEVVKAKFSQNETIKQWLLETGDATLIEGNTWGDTYWGICNGVGKNHLGNILMSVRDELRNEER